MCFSAQASFATAAGLTIIGGYAVQKAHTPSVRFFALAPLFFAAQQALEGIVWVTTNNHDTTSMLHKSAVYGFLIFAGIIWPFGTPLCIYYLEPTVYRKRLLITTVCAGGLVALSALLMAFSSSPIAINIGCHIAYAAAEPTPFFTYISPFVLGLYLYATTGAMLISSIPLMWIIGLLVAVAFAAARLMYLVAFGSVWCFFAALISIMVIMVIRQKDKKNR